MKPKKILLEENLVAFNRIEAMLELLLGKLRKVEEWQIHDRGEFHRKLDAILKNTDKGPPQL